MSGTNEQEKSAAQVQPVEGGRHFILGTAGHIDHGKTTLIKALTGTDTDRLPEEKRRGMTIELGFAELTMEDITFGIVDVPGHEKFVRTMVAGATGVDIGLIIVAADDSVMPQTVEHVEILSLLGIKRAIVAITKCDTAEKDMIDLVEEEVRELLSTTELSDIPIVRVSSTKMTGIDELRKKLLEAADGIEPEEFDQPFRMPIDRVFSVSGRGTVVTGSVVSGRLEPGETVDVWPTGKQVRIREVQTHGQNSNWVGAGQRAAVNLQGINREDIERGYELAAIDSIEPTRLLDVHFTCLASHKQAIKNNSRLRLCIGTREVLARCVILKGTSINAGESAYLQLRCRESVAATYGQRFILRDENAARTAGGGIILRAAKRRISWRMADELNGLEILNHGNAVQRVAEVLRSARFSLPSTEHIALAANVARADIPSLMQELQQDRKIVQLAENSVAVSADFLTAFEKRALNWLKGYHQSHADEPGCLTETLTGWLERKSLSKSFGKVLTARLVDSGEVKVMGRFVCLKEFAPALSKQDEKLLAQTLETFNQAGFQPPTSEELAKTLDSNKQRVEKLLKIACSTDQLVKVNNAIYLHVDREQELRDKVQELFLADGSFTMSQLRETLGASRKYVVPIGEYLDRIGFTRREGDTREVIQDAETENK